MSIIKLNKFLLLTFDLFPIYFSENLFIFRYNLKIIHIRFFIKKEVTYFIRKELNN